MAWHFYGIFMAFFYREQTGNQWISYFQTHLETVQLYSGENLLTRFLVSMMR